MNFTKLHTICLGIEKKIQISQEYVKAIEAISPYIKLATFVIMDMCAYIMPNDIYYKLHEIEEYKEHYMRDVVDRFGNIIYYSCHRFPSLNSTNAQIPNLFISTYKATLTEPILEMVEAIFLEFKKQTCSHFVNKTTITLKNVIDQSINKHTENAKADLVNQYYNEAVDLETDICEIKDTLDDK